MADFVVVVLRANEEYMDDGEGVGLKVVEDNVVDDELRDVIIEVVRVLELV